MLKHWLLHAFFNEEATPVLSCEGNPTNCSHTPPILARRWSWTGGLGYWPFHSICAKSLNFHVFLCRNPMVLMVLDVQSRADCCMVENYHDHWARRNDHSPLSPQVWSDQSNQMKVTKVCPNSGIRSIKEHSIT